ncbi:MAG: hypothetical protein JW993_10275 [Sedimentisphaerales bacterium]|nr:hypothetical protein [Sedimentisphaerales bacterium]
MTLRELLLGKIVNQPGLREGVAFGLSMAPPALAAKLDAPLHLRIYETFYRADVSGIEVLLTLGDDQWGWSADELEAFINGPAQDALGCPGRGPGLDGPADH